MRSEIIVVAHKHKTLCGFFRVYSLLSIQTNLGSTNHHIADLIFRHPTNTEACWLSFEKRMVRSVPLLTFCAVSVGVVGAAAQNGGLLSGPTHAAACPYMQCH